MSILLRHAVRYVGQKLASDPALREKTAKAARIAVAEAKHIARDDDRARAAGRALGRALNKLKSGS